MQWMKKSISWDIDLTEAISTIDAFTWTFTVDRPSIIRVSGHIDCRHRGVYNTADKAVMVAFRLRLDGSQVNGSVTGENILNETDHYSVTPIHGYVEIPAGTHTIEVQGRSASTAAPGKNGLAEIKGGYNEVVYEVFTIAG